MEGTMRRFTKLSLRALFAITTVCCLVTGYVAWSVQRFREQARLLSALDQRLGGDAGCEYTLVTARPAWIWGSLAGKDAAEIEKARFYRVWDRGEPAVGVRAGEMKIVGRWTSLKSLFVAGEGVTDDSIAPLQR